MIPLSLLLQLLKDFCFPPKFIDGDLKVLHHLNSSIIARKILKYFDQMSYLDCFLNPNQWEYDLDLWAQWTVFV